jgi:hypothetical protein
VGNRVLRHYLWAIVFRDIICGQSCFGTLFVDNRVLGHYLWTKNGTFYMNALYTGWPIKLGGIFLWADRLLGGYFMHQQYTYIVLLLVRKYQGGRVSISGSTFGGVFRLGKKMLILSKYR